MPINTEDEQIGRLHPSAGIFRDVILEEINVENKQLREDVACLQPLLDHMQKIEVIGVTNDEFITYSEERRDDGSFLLTPSAPAKVEVVATGQLSQGTVTKDGSCFKRLAIPIESTHKILLRNNVRFGGPGGIGVLMAGESLGMFPRHCARRGVYGMVNESVDVNVTDDDKVELAFWISDQIAIIGEVTDLSNEELVRFKEDPDNNFAGYMSICAFGFSEDESEDYDDKRRTTFKPMSVLLKVTDALGNTLQLIQRATSTACEVDPTPKSASDELRHLAIEAFGDDTHRNTLHLNHLLKSKKDALLSIVQEMIKVEVRHSTGILRFALDETETIVDEEGDIIHRYTVPDGNVGSSMAVADIKHSSFLLSGVKLNLDDLLLTGGISVSDFMYREGQVDGLRIPYASGIEVRGYLNWDEMTPEDLESITADFGHRLMASVSSRFSGLPAFPATFRLNVTEIRLSQKSIEHIQRLGGLDEEKASNVDDEASGSDD